jgi:formylglycine-generating enzyme required for sulfatase activity
MRSHWVLVAAATVVGFQAGLLTRPGMAQTEPEIVTNSTGMKLVLIPAGEFVMGTGEDRVDILNDFRYTDPKMIEGEFSRHTVRISKPFYLGRHEVTLGQFLQFYHAAKYKVEIERDGLPSWGYNQRGEMLQSNQFRPWAPRAWEMTMDHPVIYVSWNDASAFCKWLSEKEGKSYRLPTEAEWEYACRAGSDSRYHFGNDHEDLIRFANAADQDARAGSDKWIMNLFDEDGRATSIQIPFPFLAKRDGYRWISPVGKFRPNDFGLYDMHGNVGEWCADWYNKAYYENSPIENPQGPAAGQSRVMRGGGAVNPPVELRSTYRDRLAPSDRYCNVGFRVVCER